MDAVVAAFFLMIVSTPSTGRIALTNSMRVIFLNLIDAAAFIPKNCPARLLPGSKLTVKLYLFWRVGFPLNQSRSALYMNKLYSFSLYVRISPCGMIFSCGLTGRVVRAEGSAVVALPAAELLERNKLSSDVP